jgi:hypothetical protein
MLVRATPGAPLATTSNVEVTNLACELMNARPYICIGYAGLSACSLQPAPLGQDAERPGAPLDHVKCQAAWKMASSHGDVLSKARAAAYVLNFTVVDVNQDGEISEHEFKDACEGGWIRDPSSVHN